jgi:hypothetical protein
MHAHSLVWHYLWLGPRAFQLVICAVMLRRRLHRGFPFFFLYILYEAVQGITLFALDHSASVSATQYWQAYWIGNLGSIVLRFGMIWEIFSHVFAPYPALWEFGKLILRWSTVVLVLVAVAVAAYSPSLQGPSILSGVYVVDRTISIIQCGLLLFLFLFSSYFGLSWRSYVFGIAVGLGIYSSQQLVMSSVWMQTNFYSPNDAFRFSTMATFHCSVLIWLFYVLSKEPVRRAVGQIPDNDLELWDRELSRLLHS